MVTKFREILSNVLDDYYDVDKYDILIYTGKHNYMIKVEEVNGVEKYVIKRILGTNKLTSKNYKLDEIFDIPVKEVNVILIVKKKNKILFEKKTSVTTGYKEPSTKVVKQAIPMNKLEKYVDEHLERFKKAVERDLGRRKQTRRRR